MRLRSLETITRISWYGEIFRRIPTFRKCFSWQAPLSFSMRVKSLACRNPICETELNNRSLLFSLTAFFLVLLAGCGSTSKSPSSETSTTTNATAPTISTQPTSQTVAVGQTATFSVVAARTAPLAYQWRKSGANISGATAATYTTPATASGDSGSTFDVVVSNSSGSVTSTSAMLTVNSSSSSNPSASGTDVTTYHNDVARTGQNLTEKVLTQANLNSQTFGLLRNLTVDGKVDAEPLSFSATYRGRQRAQCGLHRYRTRFGICLRRGYRRTALESLAAGEWRNHQRHSWLRASGAGNWNHRDASDRPQRRTARNHLRGGHVEERIRRLLPANSRWM